MEKHIASSEYEELKLFLSFYSRHFMSADKLPAELRPEARLEQLEKMSASRAAQGLRQAINDIIESNRRLDQSEVKALDARLRDNGIVTLSELRRRFSSRYAKIMKKKSISDETEYYLVAGIVNDGATDITHQERDTLHRMLRDFEETKVKAGSRRKR